MNEIEALMDVDIHAIIFGIFIIMAGIIAMKKIIEDFSKIVGKPVRWIKSNNNDHEQISEIRKDIAELSETCLNLSKSLSELRKSHDELKSSMDDKDIQDMRLAILDFASAIVNGRGYTEEQYKEIFEVHDRYGAVLKRTGKTNGCVDASMKIIVDSYTEHKTNNNFKC